ncbi:MAG: glycosyltransferase family 39 protein [Polyangiaceae bacterium]
MLRDHRAVLAGFILVMVLAAATRFYHLGYESLWLDEAITFVRSGLPVRKLCAHAIRRYHNPTYFLVVHYVMALGDSEFVLRLPSAVAGILKTAVVCGLGTLIGGARLGLLSALLVVLMPLELRYDQEARMYGLLGLAAAIGMFAQFWLLRNPDASGRAFAFGSGIRSSGEAPPSVVQRDRSDGRPPDPTSDQPSQPSIRRARIVWLSYALSSVAALYLHNIAGLLVIATAISLLLCGMVSSEPRRFFSSWLVAHLGIALAFAPWLPTFLMQSGKLHERGWWAVEPDTQAVVTTLSELYGVGPSAPWLLALTISSAAYGAWRLREEITVCLSLLWLAVAGPVLLGLVTALYQPMFVTRLMVWSVVPFLILVAQGLLHLPVAFSRTLIGVALLAGLVNLHSRYYGVRQKPNWQAAVEYLAREVGQKDVVWATGGSEARSVYYYLNRSHRPARALSIDFDFHELARDFRGHYADDTESIWTLRARVRPDTQRVHDKLDSIARRTLSLQFGPELELQRYVLKPRDGRSAF